MTAPTATILIEEIIVAGVGLTTRALEEASPGLDLTFPQWRVMLVLGERTAGMTVSQVAGRIGVTVPATSRQLRRLAGRQLVEVRPDPDDRRATRASLTPGGRAARRAILAFRRKRIEQSVARMRSSPALKAELAEIAAALTAYR